MPTSKHRKGWTAARSEPKKANPNRAKLRDALRQHAAMVHAMLAEVGRNPVYTMPNVYRGHPTEKQWSKRAKAWLDANMKRYTVA